MILWAPLVESPKWSRASESVASGQVEVEESLGALVWLPSDMAGLQRVTNGPTSGWSLVMLVMLCDFPYFCIHFMYNFDPPIPIARTVPGALAPRNSPCWDSPGGWGIGKGPQIKTSDFLAPIAVVYFMFCMFCILYIGTNLVHT